MLCLLLLVASIESRSIRHSHKFGKDLDLTKSFDIPSRYVYILSPKLASVLVYMLTDAVFHFSLQNDLQTPKHSNDEQKHPSSSIVKRALTQVISPTSFQRASKLLKRVNADARIAEYYARILQNCRTLGCGLIDIIPKDE